MTSLGAFCVHCGGYVGVAESGVMSPDEILAWQRQQPDWVEVREIGCIPNECGHHVGCKRFEPWRLCPP